MKLAMMMSTIKSAIASTFEDMYKDRLDMALDAVASEPTTSDGTFGNIVRFQSFCKHVMICIGDMPGLPEVKRAGFIDKACKMVTIDELPDICESNWVNTEIIKIANRYDTELRAWLAEIVDLNNFQFEGNRSAIDYIVRYICAQDNRPH